MPKIIAKGSSWCIKPEAFEDLMFLEKNSIKIDAEILNKDVTFETKIIYRNKVAIVNISGSLMKKRSFLSNIYGFNSYAQIEAAVLDAENDPTINGILLNIDSPGGIVNGLDELSQKIKATKKPVVAYTSGTIASAAYWIASAADKIVAGKTADVGSIGVLMHHMEWSKYNEKLGIKETYLTAGKYKALGNDAEPLSTLAREDFQEQIDYTYSIFIDAVAKNRGVSTKKALEMADGKIFIGENAKSIGLIDVVGSFDDSLNLLNNLIKGDLKMPVENVTQLEEKYPELTTELKQAAIASVDIESGKKEAEKTATEKTLGLVASVCGKEKTDLITKMLGAGITAEMAEIMKSLTPEQPEKKTEVVVDDSKEKMLEIIKESGSDNPGIQKEADALPKDFEAAWKKIKDEKKCSVSDAIREAATTFPELHEKMKVKK